MVHHHVGMLEEEGRPATREGPQASDPAVEPVRREQRVVGVVVKVHWDVDARVQPSMRAAAATKAVRLPGLQACHCGWR